MLQPMQPIGQPKPGTNIGMPQGMQRAPGQQTMPAGAAFQQGILPGGITSNPEDIKAAYGGTPQGRAVLQQAADNRDYLSAIALSQILEEEREKKAAQASAMNQGGKPPPVIDRMQDEAVELRRQDLEQQQANRLGMEQQRSQSAMARMVGQAARPPMQQGIAGIPAQNVAQPQAMAAGGIVAFNGEQDGSYVSDVERKPTEEEVRPVGVAAGKPTRAGIEKLLWQRATADRAAKEEAARRDYERYAGYTPEEKAAQEKRIADMQAYDAEMYAPEKLQREGLAAALMGAANTGSIGATFAGAGTAGLNYSNKMRELARQRMEDRQNQEEKWMESQRGVRVKGLDYGQKEGQAADLLAKEGLGDLSRMSNTDVQAAMTAASRGSPQDQLYLKVLGRLNGDPLLRKMVDEVGKMDPQGDEYKIKMQQVEDYKASEFKRAGVPYEKQVYWSGELPKEEGSGILSNMGEAVKSLWGGSKYQKQQTPPPPKDFVVQPNVS